MALPLNAVIADAKASLEAAQEAVGVPNGHFGWYDPMLVGLGLAARRVCLEQQKAVSEGDAAQKAAVAEAMAKLEQSQKEMAEKQQKAIIQQKLAQKEVSWWAALVESREQARECTKGRPLDPPRVLN